MKRRTFMQAVIAAIAGLLVPKTKAAPAKKIKRVYIDQGVNHIFVSKRRMEHDNRQCEELMDA